jgi:predicted  nucleic acid-binding Zn-ribbon protein
MTQPSELEARVTALETQVRDLGDRVRHSAQDAAAARVLAGGADRDVAEVRSEIRDFRDANNRTLNAMRQDLGDLRGNLNDLRGNLNDLRGNLNDLRGDLNGLRADVDNGFAEMRGKFDATAAGLEQISGLLTTLIAQDGLATP